MTHKNLLKEQQLENWALESLEKPTPRSRYAGPATPCTPGFGRQAGTAQWQATASFQRDPLPHPALGLNTARWMGILLCPPCSACPSTACLLQTNPTLLCREDGWLPHGLCSGFHHQRTQVLQKRQRMHWALWVPQAPSTSPFGCCMQRCQPPPHRAARAAFGRFSPATPHGGCGAAPLQEPLALPLWLLPLSARHFVPFLAGFGHWKHGFCLLWASRCV